MTNEPRHDKTNKMACAPSEDSDQPGHPSKLSSCGQQRLLSDWADAQADLSLRWAHMPFCWFWHEAAQFTMYEILYAKPLTMLLHEYSLIWNPSSGPGGFVLKSRLWQTTTAINQSRSHGTGHSDLRDQPIEVRIWIKWLNVTPSGRSDVWGMRATSCPQSAWLARIKRHLARKPGIIIHSPEF